ncbi:hypothetical protein LUZ60_017352 [Juncus effusus]|nr:hypothetical protein LUZ60_017352 [Juncus effusus]
MAALDGDGAGLGGTKFDASQYAFFGNDSVNEVELGGLDEEEENNTISNSGFAVLDEELQPSYSDTKFEGEGEGLGSFSDIDDLSGTFSKLNRLEPRMGIDPHARTFSRESSAPSDFQQNWPDPNLLLNPQNAPQNQNQNNQFFNNSHPLNRTSSYPQNAPQNFTDPIPIPENPQNPNFTLRVPHIFSPPVPPSLNPNFPPNPNFAPNPNLTFRPSPPHQNPNFPSNPNLNFRPSPPHQNPNFFPNPNSPLLPPQMFLPPHHHSPPHHQIHSPPQQFHPPYRVRPNYNQTRFDSQTRYLSKHMTFEEIEHISRTQHALTHGSDPYIDDYYHQACLSKKSKSKSTHGPGPLHHHFCPTVIRDPASRTRSRDEPHAFLQVEALGRLPFSSIRRPRPLLDMNDNKNNAKNDENDGENKVKMLEEEPLLAARITIEDAMNLILDVDDIDRVLRFTQVPDNGFPLRRKRQAILEEILGSLHLVDPLRPGTNTDDFVFLRIVSLPKGRKLLSRYIEVVSENAELARVVCMAVFRHLRFLFGNNVSETGTAKTLIGTVSGTVSSMDLSSLSACLAAVVCSNEQPPLRPIGSPAGDGASVALKTVLDKATELLTKNAANYNASNRVMWQASFDAFFNLLARYCTMKYDSIVAQFGRIAGREIGREIPVEILRASLPHTNEGQRRVLIDFAQRSLPVTEFAQRPLNVSVPS